MSYNVSVRNFLLFHNRNPLRRKRILAKWIALGAEGWGRDPCACVCVCAYLEPTVKMSRSAFGHTEYGEWHLVELVAPANGEAEASTGAEECHLEKQRAPPLLVLLLLLLLHLLVVQHLLVGGSHHHSCITRKIACKGGSNSFSPPMPFRLLFCLFYPTATLHPAPAMVLVVLQSQLSQSLSRANQNNQQMTLLWH